MQNHESKHPIRSSAAEYLTFVAATGDGADSIEMRYEDENIWLTQKMMATLYDVSVSAINQHLKNIFEDGELDKKAVIKKYLITASDGKQYNTNHYNLQAIIAVGFKVNNDRAVQFRKWANGIVKDYTIQGWAIDSDRLKSGGSVLTREYFDHLLEQIREIRMSERRFYQKITDIYATALDYDKSAKTTRLFFAEVQNKLHWAIHRHTAAELIMERANAEKPHMGLTSWEQYPDGKIQKYDVSIAKNYLSKEELQALERIVTMYLDYAEYQASRHIPMTMQDWSQRLNRFLEFNEHEILHDTGRVTHEIAKAFAESEFEKYRVVQDRLFESDFDRFLTLEKEAERHNNEES
ncbi:virulence RhuM family protein [uncultured Subdoligranulum sp.]|uniref:virulence RhuM family protein n=1 Tax=uncultured Subdoligranulum sp. TaxID=512298 RepID=UPI003209865E